MKMKKIVSVALAGVMALATAVPAFAKDDKTTATTSTNIPTVSVTVPAATVILNPYGVAVTGTGTYGETLVLEDTVYSPKCVVKSTTNSPLSVTAKATAKAANVAMAADAATVAAADDKQVYLNLKVGQKFDLTDSVGTSNAGIAVMDTETDIIADAAPLTLAAGNVNPAYLYYQFSGVCTAPSALANGEWSAKDTVGVTINWKFTPGSADPAKISYNNDPTLGTLTNCNVLLSADSVNAGSTVYVFVLGGDDAGTNNPAYKVSGTPTVKLYFAANTIATKATNAGGYGKTVGDQYETTKLKLTKVTSLENAPDCIAIYSFVVPAMDENKVPTDGADFALTIDAAQA